jgi:3-deoxy-manno-octulosonate cytidylyltransferase (CMP-KDO synthetase)
MTSPIILIPARMASTRLPGKPLADIHGEPMIVLVWRRATEADLGIVLVAADDPAIVAAIKAVGGHAVMTGDHHQSGSDRIFEALNTFDPAGRFDIVVNVQGDLPTVEPETIRAATRLLDHDAVQIGTVAAPILRDEERNDPNVVKVVGSELSPNRQRALYFTRGDGPRCQPRGLNAARRAALERFVALPPSPLERREKLEQLRALEDGMRIDVAIVAETPLGVDTPHDLERARALLGERQ